MSRSSSFKISPLVKFISGSSFDIWDSLRQQQYSTHAVVSTGEAWTFFPHICRLLEHVRELQQFEISPITTHELNSDR